MPPGCLTNIPLPPILFLCYQLQGERSEKKATYAATNSKPDFFGDHKAGQDWITTRPISDGPSFNSLQLLTAIMQKQRPPPLPPLTAEMALACYKCFKDEDVRLSRCSQCLRIAYCSRAYVQGSHEIEKNRDTFVLLPSELTKDLTFLNNMTQERISNMAAFCVCHMQRELTLFERNLISSEPRCMVCTRTDQLIRIEAAINGTHTSSSPLIPCPHCGLNFCWSSDHWDVARVLHHAPCEEACDGISQCEMNMQVREDIKFQNFWTGYADEKNISRKYLLCPPRAKSSWTALTGASWENEFRDEMCQSLGVSVWIPAGSSMLRAASVHLTMAMTILYGLERSSMMMMHGRGRIHSPFTSIIAANVLEVHCGMVFEEILHRLPQIKTLKLVLCGPDVPGNRSAFDYGTCTECTQRGCKRIQEHAVYTYHAYMQKKGSFFERPDLCIAMNSGAPQVSRLRWYSERKRFSDSQGTFLVVQREEAVAEAALLRAAGATLHAALGPGKNPWGSLQVTPSHHKVYGFSAASGWIAGGFR
ncbi:hypothetical protein C8J57DRAFT_1561722 [Mycena rebaudengoi]|nr:hypothetical protein C8J57DRAFT_1561722 [Mycena rebaudengoi]